MSDRQHLNEFVSFLEGIAADITKKQFDSIKRQCVDAVPEGRLDEMTSTGQLFKALADDDKIKASNTEMLSTILRHKAVGRAKLADKVDKYSYDYRKKHAESLDYSVGDGLAPRMRTRSITGGEKQYSKATKRKTKPDNTVKDTTGEAGPSSTKRRRSLEYDETDAATTTTRGTHQKCGVPVIGIVTALEFEYTAMSLMFTRQPKHYTPRKASADPNIYAIGIIGGKHAVMTQLPVGFIGEEAAAITATRLIDEFDKVTLLFMVGIAGGVPNIHYDEASSLETAAYTRPHVRKGDVIISYPVAANDGPAFIQYDYGKIISQLASDNFKKNITRKSQIKLSPKGLSAARVLKRENQDDIRQWVNVIENTMQNRRRVVPQKQLLFKRPVDGDLELPGGVPHPQEEYRHLGEPKLHFGILASANTIMRNAEVRDKLAEAENIIGFEMENGGVAAATSLSSKQCMFVRGVCDYADDSKEKKWQYYAALAAAAVAKCIIEKLNI